MSIKTISQKKDISILLLGHSFFNEVQTIVQLFIPYHGFKNKEQVSEIGFTIKSEYTENNIITTVFKNGQMVARGSENLHNPELIKDYIKLSVYKTMQELTGISPPWGILTGIRPSKIAMSFLNSGNSVNDTRDYFINHYKTTNEKASLCIDVALKEKDILSGSKENAVSLYVGIPFCPSRCLYCSFTSYPILKYRHLQKAYLDALEKELKSIPDKTYIENIYIGGGTPSSLDEEHFERLLSMIYDNVEKSFFNQIREYTVEAGRADTLTLAKLKAMKNYGVTRISINPQTMNDNTLLLIGREHSVSDVIDSFHMARTVGLDNINMDLIIGLPGETTEHVKRTMEQIKSLNPPSVTCHALSVKRASRLKEELDCFMLSDRKLLEDMLSCVNNTCLEMNLKPYYMYRQKNTLGNLENIGYSKDGSECSYNIHIMEETHTILAVGAGAVTKVVEDGGHIFRIFNVKNVDEYINRIDEMIERKFKLTEIMPGGV